MSPTASPPALDTSGGDSTNNVRTPPARPSVEAQRARVRAERRELGLPPPVACEFCGREFANRLGLGRHRSTCAKRPLPPHTLASPYAREGLLRAYQTLRCLEDALVPLVAIPCLADPSTAMIERARFLRGMIHATVDAAGKDR